MAFFIEVNGLSELEDQEKWEDIRVMLYELWNANRDNLDLLLRLFSECWYTLCDWDVLKVPESISYQAFKDTLIECATYGLMYFNKDARFMWMAGYMISMFPYLFYDADADDDSFSDLYLKWESKGEDMLALLYKQNPNDLMAKVMYLGLCSNVIAKKDKDYREAKRKLTPLLDEYFTDNTDIELYFKEVLSDPISGGRNVKISLKTSYEGQEIQGRFFGTGSCLIILSNMDTNNKDCWTSFIQSLPLEHCKVLAYNYPQYEDDQSYVLEDVISFAKKANAKKIVLVGAGRGGIASLKAAARHVSDKTVIGVVSISALFEHEGIVFFSKEELNQIKVPKLFISTNDDKRTTPAQQMQKLISESKELCLLSGGAHGTEIFDTAHRDTLIEKLNVFINSMFDLREERETPLLYLT